MASRILVTGATGKQGGACVNALLAHGGAFEIYGLTRSASSPAAQKLAARGVHVVEGNLDAPEALLKQIPKPLDGIFAVSVFAGRGQDVKSETRQANALFDAAQAAGTRHFVYTSVARNGFQPTRVHHFASKHAVEVHVKDNARTMGWTILQPVAFMDNIQDGGFAARAFFTSLEAYIGRQKPLQYIATEDIGKFAAQVFANPEKFNGESVLLAGDSLSVGEAQRIYTERSGQKSGTLPHFTARIFGEWVMPDIGLMMKWFKEEGYPADAVTQTKKVFPEVMSFDTWAKKTFSRQ